MRLVAAILAGNALVMLALTACGGGDGEPEPTPARPTATRTQRPQAERPTATMRPISVPTVPVCADPYPDGAPFEIEAGEQIRLQPAGSPQALAPFTPTALTTDLELERVVKDAIEDEEEHFAVYVKSLVDSKGVAIEAGRQFYAASLYKTWAALEALHQRDAGVLEFNEEYIASDYYAALGLNPGEVQSCARVSIGDAIARMMSFSDNVAANIVLDRVGAGNVNVALSMLGLSASGFIDGTLPTSARDMALLLEAVARGEAPSDAASDEMLVLLESEAIDDRIPALLPRGTRVAHKTGSWDSATHDAGIVFSPGGTYIIVVLTDYGYADRGADRIASLSKAVYDYYNE